MERLHRAASRAITSCLSSSPIPLFLSEASLPPLRVTLTHFTLSSYERVLRLPTSFPISGLARLGVKPRLYRSSWKALASTHPLMLPSSSPRKTLLAYPPSPPWNLPSFIVESTLSLLCSRSDLPLSRQGAALAHFDSLPSHDLVLWTDGSVPFPFGKVGSGVLSNCSLSVALRPLFPFQQAQFVQVFLLKHAPFYRLFAGLGSTNKPATSLLFSSYLNLVLSSPLCPLLHLSFYLKLSGRSGRNCLFSPVLSGYNGFPGHSFARGATRLMTWLDRERYLLPLQSLVVSLLLSLVSTLLFSRTGSVLTHRNSLTHRFPRFSLRNLCSLVTLAVFSLVFAATDTGYC